MDYLSLEKITDPSPSSENKPSLVLRIISPLQGMQHFADDLEVPLILIRLDRMGPSLRYLSKEKRVDLELELVRDAMYRVQWPQDLSARIRDHFELLVTTSSFDALPQTWPTSDGKKAQLVIPVFGEGERQWKDGFIAHFLPDATISSLLAPGRPYRLYIPIETTSRSGLSWANARAELAEEPELHRQCIVTMLRTKLSEPVLAKIQIRSFTLCDAARLLLIRQAFPDARLHVSHNSPKKTWPKRFKNFLESIRSEWSTGDEGFALDSFFENVEDEMLLGLVPVLNAPTRILAGILPRHPE